MEMSNERFYAEMRNDYAGKIRQLVPLYDDLIHCQIDLLRLASPGHVLDIGPGPGQVTRLILEALPEARVTAVEASSEMAAAAQDELKDFGERATVVCQNAVDFAPTIRFDGVFSSLVLHNIPHGPKAEILEKIRSWLEPGGVFVWGDMIYHEDARLQAHYVQWRKDFSRAAGCPKDLLAWNYRKEEKEDFPLTLEDSVEVALKAGFRRAHPVWAHDTFAVLRLTR